MSNRTCTDNELRLQLEIQKLSWRHFNSVASNYLQGVIPNYTPLATNVCSDCHCDVIYMCVNWRELSMWADAHTLSIHESKARHEASLCNKSSGPPLALAGSRGGGVWVWGCGCEGVGVWLPPEQGPSTLVDHFITHSTASSWEVQYTQSQFFLLTLF